MDTRVVNIKKEKCDVYIGRGSKFGNPFVLKRDTIKERQNVIKLYEDYYYENKLFLHIPELVGKVLGCFCKPKLCHGDFLARQVMRYLNNEDISLPERID